MKRRYEVDLSVTVTIEIDDAVTSTYYDGETVLTAHENRERFVEGSTLDTALGSLAEWVGIENRRISNVDGWADFPDEAARRLGWPEVRVDDVTELIAPEGGWE